MASHGSSFQKTFMGAAGSGGAGLDVTDVFSTNLYTGNNSALTVNTGLDQNTEGGMLWVKSRSTSSTNHGIWDTERTNGYYLPVNSSDNGGNISAASGTNPFLRDDSFRWNAGHGWFNQSGDYVAWAFRKAPKFFDIVTYTGNGTNNRSIAHNLGSVPGCIITKMTSGAKDWKVYHRGLDASNPQNYKIHLNENSARSDGSTLFDAPTDTHFILDSNDDVNGNNDTYVAYLFAHNDGDGKFGPAADQDIIKCGSYTGNSNDTPPEVSLGFEPQWMLVKNVTSGGSTNPWILVDTMRGWGAPSTSMTQPKYLDTSLANPEGTTRRFGPTANGFMVRDYHASINSVNQTYIYMAIRRGPLNPPEAATEVFAIATGNEVTASKYNYHSGFPVDMAWRSVNTNERAYIADRLRGPEDLWSDSNRAEVNNTSSKFDDNVSWYSSVSTDTNAYSWMFRRAPSFFDVVAYTGSGVAGRTVSHNLGVAPEMMWVKERDNATNWNVYHTGLNGGTTPQDYFMRLNIQNAEIDNNSLWNDTAPTDTQFTVGLASDINGSNDIYIAYLFATLAGISKVGSFTGNGSSQTIDCGFTSGASFILVKRTNSSGSWRYFDSKRGIVAGNDTSSKFNGSDAYVTNVDEVDPQNSGFIINQTSTSDLNVSNATYIFYAIASIA